MKRTIVIVTLLVLIASLFTLFMVQQATRPAQGDGPELVVIDGTCYVLKRKVLKTPEEPFDGTITSCVDPWKNPTEDLQTNFLPFLDEPYVFEDEKLYIRKSDGHWYLFVIYEHYQPTS